MYYDQSSQLTPARTQILGEPARFFKHKKSCSYQFLKLCYVLFKRTLLKLNLYMKKLFCTTLNCVFLSFSVFFK